MKKFVLTITGPSAGGKSTLERMLVEAGVYERVISTTTREPRDGEVDGDAYYFVSVDEFVDLERAGQLIESVSFKGNSYGITKSELDAVLSSGKAPVVIVEPNGLKQIREALDGEYDVMSIFVTNKVDVLLQRFQLRWQQAGAKNPEYNETRMVGIYHEANEWIKEYDWDAIFERFDEDNNGFVVDFLVGHAAQKAA